MYGKDGAETYRDLEVWLELLNALAAAYPDNVDIQLNLAKGTVNAIASYGSGGPVYFLEVESSLARLESLARIHSQFEFQLRLAMGAVNAINAYGSSGSVHLSDMERCLKRLEVVVAAHSDHSEFQFALAKGAFNACIHYNRGGLENMAELAHWLERLVELPEPWPGEMHLLLQSTFARLQQVALAANNNLPPEYHSQFQAFLRLCLRYPELPLGQTSDGRPFTTGMYAAQFLPDQDEAAA